MIFKNFGIGSRLAFAFSILLGLLLVTATLGLVQMAGIQDKLNEIVFINNVEADLVNEMRIALYKRAVTVRNLVILTRDEDMRQESDFLHEQGKLYQEAEEKLGRMLLLPDTTEEEKTLFANIKAAKNITMPLADKVAELGLVNKNDEATNFLLHDVQPAQRKWLDLLKSLARGCR